MTEEKEESPGSIVSLELSNMIREADIVTNFVFNRKTNSVILCLNHIYDKKTVVAPLDFSNWSKSVGNLEKQLEKKGVEKQHIIQLSDIVDSNYQRIIDFKVNEEEEKNKQQEILELVEDNVSELFLDQYGTEFASIKINEHIETMSLQSKRFRNWLCRSVYEITGNILKNEDISGVLNILKAKAQFGSIQRELQLRVARGGSKSNTDNDNLNNDSDSDYYSTYYYYYDLTNPDWEVVKVTSDNGWSIDKSPTPIIFRRYGNSTQQQAQVYPVRDYPVDIFDQFMNLINVKDDDNKLLLKCYIISLFVPEIPKPILMLHGEQGSAKSTLQELIKMLVDPNIISALSFPRDINELIQQLSHNYISYFDNISTISDWTSDQLCRAVTGSGFQKRQLYTDDDDIIYNFKRCIGLNGINLGATKADLLDRGLIIQLDHIPDKNKRKLESIWKEFYKIRPQLLGYIFDILVKVLQKKKNRDEGAETLELKGYPRMADFAEIAEIISRCMRYPDNKFLGAYYKNIGIQTEQALEASPVATAIIEFMGSREEWIGTATELLTELGEVAETLKINTKNRNSDNNSSRQWPGAPNSLSRRINEVKTNLRQIGIIIERPIDTRTNTKLVKICKISPESPISPIDSKQARFEVEDSGDISSNMNTIPPEISPQVNTQNQVQNNGFGDTGDTGDNIRTSSSSCLY